MSDHSSDVSGLNDPLPTPGTAGPSTPATPSVPPGTNSVQSNGDWLGSILGTILAESQSLGTPAPSPQVSLTTTGPAMKVDIDTVKQVVAGWAQIRQQLDDLHAQGVALGQIQGPGNDDASHGFASQANGVGDSHQQANRALTAAVQAHVDKLNAAIRQYQTTEHGNATNLRSQDN